MFYIHYFQRILEEQLMCKLAAVAHCNQGRIK